MSLPSATSSKKDDIPALLYIAFSCKFTKKPKVQLWHCRKIEGLQWLYNGELRLSDATVQPAFRSGLQFCYGQIEEKLVIADSGFPGLPYKPLHVASHGR